MTGVRQQILDVSDRQALILWLVACGFRFAKRNNAWVHLQGHLPGWGDLEATLPRAGNDSSIGERTALRLFEIVAEHWGEGFEDARFRISGYNRDLHLFRVGDDDFISIGEASKHPQYIRQLIGYAHAAERKGGLPYFSGGTLKNKKLDNYEFGHTIRGSFILTVRSPRLGKAEQVSVQRELEFDGVEIVDDDTPDYVLPLARRVSQRLTRSLSLVHDTYQKTDRTALESSYTDSLNANMAEALASILKEADELVSFKTIWSPALRDYDAVEDTTTTLSPAIAPVLREAARGLREKEPRVEEIMIVVTGMVSDAPPMEIDSSKKVFAKWIQRNGSTRSVQLHITKPEYYRLAQEAHNEWRSVYVVGTLDESRNRLYMRNISYFGYRRQT